MLFRIIGLLLKNVEVGNGAVPTPDGGLNRSSVPRARVELAFGSSATGAGVTRSGCLQSQAPAHSQQQQCQQDEAASPLEGGGTGQEVAFHPVLGMEVGGWERSGVLCECVWGCVWRGGKLTRDVWPILPSFPHLQLFPRLQVQGGSRWGDPTS